MNKNKLKEVIREVIAKVLSEGPATAPSKPSTSPGPAVAPGKPGEKQKPRRPLGNPNVKPKPKASMNEEEMLKKIVDRFKSKKITENNLEEVNPEVRNMGIGVALFLTSMAGLVASKTRVKDALEDGKKVEVRFEKPFFSDNDKSSVYTIKVDPNQSQEVKVDTATNTVTFNSTDLNRQDILYKASRAIRDIDPELVRSYTGRRNWSRVEIKD